MNIEICLKVLGGVSALFAIGERVYFYSRKIYIRIKSESKTRKALDSFPPPVKRLNSKKAYFFYILECRVKRHPELCAVG
jgi:hypothetical protein